MSEEQKTYRITTTGDGAGTTEITCTWDDLVDAVANEMFFDPDYDDVAQVRDDLENGIDGDEGWDGQRVLLNFEDGSLAVELVEQTPNRESK